MNIFETFRQAADPENAVAMSAYMRDKFPFLGIKTPERKKLAKGFLDAMDKRSIDWSFIDECWNQPEREFQYVAISYLEKRKQLLTPKDIPNLRDLAITKSWWDTIDGLDAIVGAIALSYPEVNETILAWSRDDNFWLRRIAIDHQLQRKEKTNTELLAKILMNNFNQTEFFINKAIGWALRAYSKTDPEWVRAFIAQHQSEMAPLSIREGSKYL